MPKDVRKRYHAVRVGRQGPRIYDTWDECEKNIIGFPGAMPKGFMSLSDAQDWLFPCARSQERAKHEAREDGNVVKTSGGSDMGVESRTTVTGVSETPSDDASTIEPLAVQVAVQDAPPIVLSDEQQVILQRVKAKHNVFFTGSAGTGKSVLLREIIKLFSLFQPTWLAVTASTGIAALNIGGVTLHSWAGIGLGKEPSEKLAKKIMYAKPMRKVKDRWRRVKYLIIDEVSMIDGKLFDKLEYIARFVRENNFAIWWHSGSLVISGDFCQLPPVPDQKDGAPVQPVFAFDAESWSRCIGPPLTLTRVFRQRDQEFIDMLNSMRFGDPTEQAVEEFQTLMRPIEYDDGIGPTELYPTRKEVAGANRCQLDLLKGPEHRYKAIDRAGRDSQGNQITIERMKIILDRLVAPSSLTLKTGAQVMLIKNTVQGLLVNGSTGVVTGFYTWDEAVKIGKTIVDTRSKRDKEKGRGIPKIAKSSKLAWPLVRFTNGCEMLCIPVEFTEENSEGELEAQRTQVPLILAWAMSVHKSQGQTLQRVKVDLQRTFENGQAYVALSRATNLDALQVLNFDRWKVRVHPRVREWYQLLEDQRTDLGQSFDEYDEYMDDDDAVASYFTKLS